jgi:capsular exopolysaccharide synthesis family protein
MKQNNNNKTNRNKEYELSLKELFGVLSNYKFLILLVTSLFFLLSTVYLFFKPSIYDTHGMIEVNTYDKNSKLTDDLLQNAFYSTNKELGKEMAILKTYNINKAVIKSMNMETQVFIKDKYKKHEIYGDNNPITIDKIKILNRKIIGKMIGIVQRKGGFSLKIEKGLFFSQKDELPITDKVFTYGSLVETTYFKCVIKKIKDVDSSLYFVLNGDSRAIYENIVTKQLDAIEVKKDAPLIKITYEDTIPERASKYVNRLIDNFLKDGLDSKNERNKNILGFIKEQSRRAKEQLDLSESRLKNYKIENNIIDSHEQSSAIIKKLSNLEIKISENTLRQRLVGMLTDSDNIETITPILVELEDGETVKLLTALHQLELDKKELSAEYTDEFQGLITINQKIMSTRDKISSSIEKMVLTVNLKDRNLRKLKKEYEKSLLRFPTKEIKLVNLTRNYEVNSKMYAYLLEKKSENEMIQAAIISDYKVVERAYPSDKPVKPKKSLITLFSIILGFIVGMILALIHNNSIDKIESVENIEDSSFLLVNGTIPFAKRYRRRKVRVFEDSKSIFANSFRKLRVDLKFIYNATLPKTILVTSDMNKDGTSVVVANLSAVLQLAGYKCVVVDLNLETPIMHRYFDVKYTKGISDYLSGKENNLEDTIYSTIYPNLDIVPAGNIPSGLNPSELIFSDKVDTMFSRLKEDYDYILIDSAPIGLTSDTINLMKYADINLVVFRANKTKKVAINNLEKLVGKYDIKNVGLILNKTKFSKKSNSYI